MRSTDLPMRANRREAMARSARNHYYLMSVFGASAAELQEIAWVTYLGNVYEEEIA